MAKIKVIPQNHGSQSLHRTLLTIMYRHGGIAGIRDAHEVEIPENYRAHFQNTVQSQFNIATALSATIEANPDTVIIAENFDLAEVENNREIIANVFPQKLPSNFSDLNLQQKMVLATLGAKHYLAGNNLGKFYSDDFSFLENFSEVLKLYDLPTYPYYSTDEGYRKFLDINDRREHNAVKKALEAAKQAGSEEVFLIYGGAHLFKDMMNCFPGHTLEITNSTDFLDSITCQNAAKDFEKLTTCKPMPQCDYLQSSWTAAPKISDKNSCRMGYDNDSTFMNNTILGSVALAGLGLVGLFKLYKKATNEETTHTLSRKDNSNRRSTKKKR